MFVILAVVAVATALLVWALCAAAARADEAERPAPPAHGIAEPSQQDAGTSR